MAFLELFLPKTAEKINRALPIGRDIEKSPPPLGATSSRGARRPDVVITASLLEAEASTSITIVEHQHNKDDHLIDRRVDSVTSTQSEHPGQIISRVIICAGHVIERGFLIKSVISETISIIYEIKVFNLSDYDLKELENDPRLFALILRVALLEKASGKEPAQREETARKALELLKGKNLPPEVTRDCYFFAWTILRLDDEAIDYKLRKEFRMFITDDKEIELLLTRQEGQLEGLQKGLQEGRQEGLQEGRQEGRQEGLQEGRQEERREMVMKMLVKGLTLDTISELSGLSEREIIALRDGPRTN